MLSQVEAKRNLDLSMEAERFRTLKSLNLLKGKIKYGFSSAAFGSMAGKYGGVESIVNRHTYAEAAGFDINSLAIINPEHSNKILVVGQEEAGIDLSKADGLITTEKGITLALLPADCIPIIITNREAEFVAMVHAGRGGTDEMIGKLAVDKLRNMGFDPKEFVVGMGPAVGCYEQKYLRTRSPDLWLDYLSIVGGASVDFDIQPQPEGGYIVRHIRGHSIWADLVGCNLQQLVNAGVPRESIETSGICTACYAERRLIYSHLLSSQYPEYQEGRFMAFVQMV